jgi:hypothetical protein
MGTENSPTQVSRYECRRRSAMRLATISPDDEVLRVRCIFLEVLNMTAKWKWILWITGALLLAIVASVVFIENRGGHYPIYNASSFSNLAPSTVSTASTTEPGVPRVLGLPASMREARRFKASRRTGPGPHQLEPFAT